MTPRQRDVLLSIAFMTFLCLLPRLSTAYTWECAGGDTPCLVATLAKFQQHPHRYHTLVLGPGTYTLTVADNTDDDEGGNGLPSLVGRVTIQGAGPDITIIERDPSAPLFRLLMILDQADVTLEGLTFQGGALDPAFFFRAGGIANHGTLTMRDCVLRHNSAWLGGGLGSDGVAHLIRVSIEENAAEFVAAGIATNGRLTVEDCWIANNVAEEEAGIGIAPADRVVIRRSTLTRNIATLNTAGGMGGVGEMLVVDAFFFENSAGGRGGAINLDSGRLTLHQVAVIRNTAENFGGGIAVEAGEVQAVQTTIVGNRVVRPFGVGGGVLNIAGDVRLRRSILAGNEAFEGPDCAGAVTLQGRRNIVGNTEGCTITQE
jgi:predicted outer membrane repeat protein